MYLIFLNYLKLMKPRVMSLVIFTCAVGLLMAPITIATKDAMIAILLVSIGAGAAGALNMWYESDLDALMTRTCLRPIPMGKVNKKQALNFWNITFIFFSNRIRLFCKYNFCITTYYSQFYFMCLFTQSG